MKYQLHDAEKELWGWVKARAYTAGLTINNYILSILVEAKREEEIAEADAAKYKVPGEYTRKP